MSWGFELAGRDKETLKSAVAEEIAQAKKWNSGHEAVIEPLVDSMVAALDRQYQLAEGYAYRVKSGGHIDANGGTGSFEIGRIKLV